MSSTSIEDIQTQEENIFKSLDLYDLENESLLNQNFVRLKARQQLNVSEDSPFNLNALTTRKQPIEQDLKRLKEERAKLLQKETDEIKEQLEILRGRLNELRDPTSINNKVSDDSSQMGSNRPSDSDKIVAKDFENNPRDDRKVLDYSEMPPEGSNNSDSKNYISPRTLNVKRCDTNQISTSTSQTNDLRLRPLTGQADCPNCKCDRRTSVCDQCVRFSTFIRPSKSQETCQNEDVTLDGNIPTRRLSAAQCPRPLVSVNPDQIDNCAIPISSTKFKRHNADDRPIRPANKPLLCTKVDKVVTDDLIVPSRLYTIGKSLNDKRTKLAQAIDELNIMMDKVKKRSDRLDQERKLVQLYKDQWKYGPTIGGPSASLRARLGQDGKQKRNYESRLDPRLTHDSKALDGFQHIEPGLRLRQYTNTSRSSSVVNNPRTFNRNTDNLLQRKLSKARSQSLESLRPTITETRPKTFIQRKITDTKRHYDDDKPMRSNGSQKGFLKSSSDTNLSSPDVIEENIEDEIRENEEDFGTNSNNLNDIQHHEGTIQHNGMGRDNNAEPTNGSLNCQLNGDESREIDGAKDVLSRESKSVANQANLKVKKKSWEPVFGETEIKVIKRVPINRKVQVLSSDKQQQSTNQDGCVPTSRGRSTVPKRSALVKNNGDKIIHEATRRIQFASDLLDKEHQECGSTNQLVVNKHQLPPTPKPRQAKASRYNSSSATFTTRTNPLPPTRKMVNVNLLKLNSTDSQKFNSNEQQTKAKDLIIDAGKEISRLEEMINEQHKLLTRLTQNATLVSPITVSTRCLSPSCCSHFGGIACGCKSQDYNHSISPSSAAASSQSRVSNLRGHIQGRSVLISQLKDKLNRTKARLARTLEEEREKHEQLRQKVNTSLRKQSDLESENELLKQSLNSCIDTCLKDILSTFESMSETLNDSIAELDKDETLNITSTGTGTTHSANELDQASTLKNAAQLIADNRHLRKMKSIIEVTENQRRRIFDELKDEKQKSKLLEDELEQSRNELNELIMAKERLELQLEAIKAGDISFNKTSRNIKDNDSKSCQQENRIDYPSSKNQNTETSNIIQPKPSCSWQSASNKPTDNHDDDPIDTTTTWTDDSTTFNSIDAYRQYIQTMSPDLESIKRERQMILSEFDNIKKALSNMDQ